MWTCPVCSRKFQREGQSHTCRRVELEEHFKNKELARNIFDVLVQRLNKEVGKSDIISIPCCIHLFGNYDYLAALPKKDRLELHFVLSRALKNPRIRESVPVSQQSFMNCLDLRSKEDIDEELINWLGESYNLK